MEYVEQLLGGWGNYPLEPCHVIRPETVTAFQDVVTTGIHSNCIARGLGRAYGDAALNRDSGVIVLDRCNRFLAWDENAGILACESGVSLAEIIRDFLPRGWFLPTTPGTKYVTIGGAIAADIHGKNHHVDGSFGNFVLDLDLLTASGDVLTCSPTQNAPLFWATLGGMGLTGIILSARIYLRRVESVYVNATYRRTTNIDETLECFQATSNHYRYSVAWIDCLASGESLGRSVLMLANDSRVVDLPSSLRHRPLTLPRKRELSVPFSLPAFLLHPSNVKAFNALYYASHRDNQRLVDYDTFFYPLDNILHWNRAYGRRGFIQYQALLPLKTSRSGLIELLEEIVRSQKASFLGILKSCGPATRGLLSYLSPGHTLALDFPNTGEDLRHLTRELDRILLKHGGCLYLAKDSMTTAATFASMYPNLNEFRAVKARVDPNNQFVSSQAKRVGIVKEC